MANEPTGHGASNESGASRRPFLNDEPDAPGLARGDNTVSILAALSSTMQMPAVQIPPARVFAWKPWLLASGALLVIGALGFGYATSQRPSADTPAALASADEPRAAPAAPAVPAIPAIPATAAASQPSTASEVALATVGASAPVTSEAAAVARVEDLPVAPPSSAVLPGEAAKPTEGAAASAPLAAADTPKAPAKAATRVAVADAPRHKEKREAPVVRHAAGDKASRDVKVAMVERRAAPSTTHESAAAVSSQADSDVDLMAALLDHMAKSKSAEGTADAFARGPSTAARPMTISGLVDSCKSAGSKSAVTECRRQICKGYWGKAQACPAHLAPPGAVARKKSDN